MNESEKSTEYLHQGLTSEIIGAAMEVHSALGPGLLESAYESCLCRELVTRNLGVQRQLDVPVVYKGVDVECGFRIDLLVEDTVIVEIKAVERILPVHEAQLLTYLRLSHKEVGLLLNFHVATLRDGGIVRRALTRVPR